MTGVAALRCPACGEGVVPHGDALVCGACDARYPVIDGTPRMLIAGRQPAGEAALSHRTAASFAYEWERFGVLRAEWAKNFADYLRPHTPQSLAGKTVLDVGTGSGRHAFHAAQAGADVVAVDLGASIDVARRNLPPQDQERVRRCGIIAPMALHDRILGHFQRRSTSSCPSASFTTCPIRSERCARSPATPSPAGTSTSICTGCPTSVGTDASWGL